MKRGNVNWLAEARIQEASTRGELTNLRGQGHLMPCDDLAGLPYEDRITALIHRSAGGAPEEVALLKELGQLRDALDQATTEAEKSRITKTLRNKAIRLSLLFESTGRPELGKSVLSFEK